MKLTNGVILDSGSLENTGHHDINFDCLSTVVDHWQTYDHTEKQDTLSRIKDADIVISNKVMLDEVILKQTNQLKLICIAATGTNNVDLVAAKKHGIQVCNVRAYATHSVVQHVFSLLLLLHTNICRYEAAVRNHQWDSARHFCLLDYPITELSGKTLGIIGYGELGKAVAKAAAAFGLNVLIAQSLKNRKKSESTLESVSERTQEGKLERVELRQLFAESDIITLHCPLTKETENLINKVSLSLMKPECILINTSRGGVVNEMDLLNALKNNTIAAAGLDVLNQEPPNANPLIEANLPNLIITPHIAWASQSSRQRLVNEIGENIKAFLAGNIRNSVA